MDTPPPNPPPVEDDEHPDTVNDQAITPQDPFTPQATLALDHVPPINVEVGTGTTHPPSKPRALPMELGGLRIIIIGWCFWLLGSWGVAMLLDTGTPRARWMLLSALIGMMLGYPAVRLSQAPNPDEPGRGALQVLMDWLCMISIFQAVLWSLHFLAAWPIFRGLWLDAAVVAWSLLAALIVGWARLYHVGGVRLLAMALCIALLLAEPLALWLAGVYPGSDRWLLRISPLQAVWELSAPPTKAVPNPWAPHILLIGLIAMAGWGSLVGWRLIELALPVPVRPEPELVDLTAQERMQADSDTIARRSTPSE
ncbi:MAG: hypothetical protein AAGH88_01400 [Planctomycetota bacterium]